MNYAVDKIRPGTHDFKIHQNYPIKLNFPWTIQKANYALIIQKGKEAFEIEKHKNF